MFDSLFGAKVILVSGKGGTGKSLFVSQLAKKAAAQGKRVCIVETGVSCCISRYFQAEAGQIGETIRLTKNIDSINVEMISNLKDFVIKRMPKAPALAKVFDQKFVRSLCEFLPGIESITLLGKLYDLATRDCDAYDLVIFDGYSLGHFEKLLATPSAIIGSEFFGIVNDLTHIVNDFFADEKNCQTILVTNFEYLPIEEMLDFIPKLNKYNIFNCSCIILNRIPYYLTDASQLELNPKVRVWKETQQKRIEEVMEYLKNHEETLKDFSFFGMDDDPSIETDLDLEILRPIVLKELESHFNG